MYCIGTHPSAIDASTDMSIALFTVCDTNKYKLIVYITVNLQPQPVKRYDCPEYSDSKVKVADKGDWALGPTFLGAPVTLYY